MSMTLRNAMADQLRDVLRRNLRFVGPQDAFSLDTDLDTLGLDSMGAINLLFDLEQTFGVMFPDAMLTAETFRSGATLLEAVEQLRL